MYGCALGRCVVSNICCRIRGSVILQWRVEAARIETCLEFQFSELCSTRLGLASLLVRCCFAEVNCSYTSFILSRGI